MRLKSSHLFALGMGGAVVLFFVVAAILNGGKHGEARPTPGPAANPALSVQVTPTPESQHAYTVVVRGRTSAARTVQVRSETAGAVAGAPVLQGTVVPKGAVLCRLNVDAREAGLAQARAALRSAQLTQDASADLARKGFRSQTQVLQTQAALDNAQALVRQAEIALEQTNIRAPFAGVFDHRDAEVGSYLATGQSCGSMIELDPLLIVGDVPETEAGKLHLGAAATATLVSGEVLNGRIRYVSSDADPQTRTYHLEITVPNPRLTAKSGLSATVKIQAGIGPAHLVPVSSLVLDAAGRQGVRYVLADNRVAFAPVSVIEETAGGMWVSGLHGPVRVITVGQSYVNEGQTVRVASR
jgi:multidrug efflux system membrane fusion protein